MDFTEIYRQSAGLVAFSPGAHFILTAVADRLVVRRADTFHVSRSWQVPSLPTSTAAAITPSPASSRPLRPGTNADNITQSVITHIDWSPDSEYVFAACAKFGSVYVFRMRDEEWSAQIETGAEGLIRAEWAPDGRHVLCFSEWGVSHRVIHKTPYSCASVPSLSHARLRIAAAPASCDCLVPYCRYSNVHPVSPAP
jgi:hypothetical protein